MRSIASIIVAVMLLGGCDMPSLSSMAAFYKVDPMTTDPAQIRLAVAHPETVKIEPNGLSFLGTLTKTDSQPEQAFSFHMSRTDQGAAESRLAKGLQAGNSLSVFRIDPGRLESFHAFRTMSIKSKRSGALSVSVVPCFSESELPAEIVISVHILAAELADYAELVGPTDVTQELSAEQLSQIFVACE